MTSTHAHSTASNAGLPAQPFQSQQARSLPPNLLEKASTSKKLDYFSLQCVVFDPVEAKNNNQLLITRFQRLHRVASAGDGELLALQVGLNFLTRSIPHTKGQFPYVEVGKREFLILEFPI